jgi:hypothetical protein
MASKADKLAQFPSAIPPDDPVATWWGSDRRTTMFLI